MFKQLFISMNDALDEILLAYPSANKTERACLDERLSILKSISDTYMEEWLLFEEKMGKLLQDRLILEKNMPQPQIQQSGSGSGAHSDASGIEIFNKAQGYYNLYMFEKAVEQFEKLVKQQPDFLLARIYLAMGYLRLGKSSEAYRHFQFLVPLTDDMQSLEKAFEYFTMAYFTDPQNFGMLE